MAKKSKKKAFKKHVAFGGRMVMIGLRLDRPGRAAADLPPHRHQARADHHHLGRGSRRPEGDRALRRQVHQEAADAGELPRRSSTSGCGKGDFLVNLSVEVASTALVEFCQEKGALYIDTCIEPWPGGYTDPNLSVSRRSNYALRETMLALKPKYEGGPTAVIAHGANPGLVSHFVKQALVNLAKDTGLDAATPTTREGWGQLARDLGVKVIHIAERDTQVSQEAQEGRRVRQHLVDRRLRLGRLPAGRDGLGHAREAAAATTVRITISAAARRSTSIARA